MCYFLVVLCLFVFFFFFFKQKTAYEMRISDWSSDVCSSDLAEHISDASLPTAYPETPCALIADMMVESGIGRVPIVEPKTRRLVGLLARQDLLKARNTQRRSETGRSEERRVGQECGRTCRSRGETDKHKKKKRRDNRD